MSAASRCLNNALILQKVMESFDLLANLQFRLVDKRFDREVLHRIRVSHKQINIYVEKRCLPKIKVNGSFVPPRDCFTFLINTVGVRVEEFKFKTDENLAVIYPFGLSFGVPHKLHNDIVEVLLKDQTLNVFKGMSDTEEYGCDHCSKHAMQSKVYGPVQQRFLLQSFDEPKRLDVMIVDDESLWRSACTIDVFSQTREEYEQEKAKSFHSNISCEHLQLSVYNHPDFFEDAQRRPIEAALPRELLEGMCMKWRPKSVGLSVISLVIGREWEAYWRRINKFQTEFRFFDPYESTRVSRGFMLDHMDVDMDDAPLKSIFREDSSFFDDNLIANVRKVFPARHYSVNLHRMSICHQLNQCRLEHLIRAVIRGTNQSNTSPVTVRISSDITDKPFDIPETLSVEERMLTCSVSRNSIEDVFGTTRRIAKSFRISHKYTGLEMNLEIYVDRKQLEEAIGKDVDLGFLKHYVD